MRTTLLTLLGLVGTASSAGAGICVDLDAKADRLAPEEQASARLMFENALRASEQGGPSACDETWTLTHVKLGGGVQVLVVTPAGALTASSTLDQLGTAYEGLVWRGLAMRAHAVAPVSTRAPGLTPPPVVDPDPAVTTASPAPAPPGSGPFYVRLASPIAPVEAGSVLEPRFGPTIGLGYRRPVDKWLFDVSVLNTHAWRRSEGNDYDANILSFGRIAAYYLFPNDKGSSFYTGGGLSFGQSVVQYGPDYYGNSDTLAIQVEGTAGYEFMQDRSVRVFLEANFVAPLSKVDTVAYSVNGAMEVDSHWAPTMQLSAGIGF